jgi:hypothetical protein
MSAPNRSPAPWPFPIALNATRYPSSSTLSTKGSPRPQKRCHQPTDN